MIIRMVDQAEHEEKLEPVLHGIQIEKIRQIYENLNENMRKHSIAREYCVNGTYIIQQQPQINVNVFILQLLSDYTSIEHILKLVNECTCCSRHSQNKPKHINTPYKMIFNTSTSYYPTQHQNKYKQRDKNGNVYYCHCKCRKIARMISIACHDLFHINSLYYRTTLLYNYCQSLKKLEYHTREVERIQNNPQSRKRKRKSYRQLKEHRIDVEDTKNNLKYETAYLQYHLTMFPNIQKEAQYLHLYETIPMENVDIQQFR